MCVSVYLSYTEVTFFLFLLIPVVIVLLCFLSLHYLSHSISERRYRQLSWGPSIRLRVVAV